MKHDVNIEEETKCETLVLALSLFSVLLVPNDTNCRI